MECKGFLDCSALSRVRVAVVVAVIIAGVVVAKYGSVAGLHVVCIYSFLGPLAASAYEYL